MWRVDQIWPEHLAPSRFITLLSKWLVIPTIYNYVAEIGAYSGISQLIPHFWSFQWLVVPSRSEYS